VTSGTAHAQELLFVLLFVLLIGRRWPVVGTQQALEALVVDGLPAVKAFRVPGQRDLDAVAGPLGDLRRIGPRPQPGGHSRVPEVQEHGPTAVGL
jgi:hypothetical protein